MKIIETYGHLTELQQFQVESTYKFLNDVVSKILATNERLTLANGKSTTLSKQECVDMVTGLRRRQPVGFKFYVASHPCNNVVKRPALWNTLPNHKKPIIYYKAACYRIIDNKLLLPVLKYISLVDEFQQDYSTKEIQKVELFQTDKPDFIKIKIELSDS